MIDNFIFPFEFSFIHEHCGQCGGKSLGGRTYLKNGFFVYRIIAAQSFYAVAFGEDEFAILNNTNGHTGDIPIGHCLGCVLIKIN